MADAADARPGRVGGEADSCAPPHVHVGGAVVYFRRHNTTPGTMKFGLRGISPAGKACYSVQAYGEHYAHALNKTIFHLDAAGAQGPGRGQLLATEQAAPSMCKTIEVKAR